MTWPAWFVAIRNAAARLSLVAWVVAVVCFGLLAWFGPEAFDKAFHWIS